MCAPAFVPLSGCSCVPAMHIRVFRTVSDNYEGGNGIRFSVSTEKKKSVYIQYSNTVCEWRGV